MDISPTRYTIGLRSTLVATLKLEIDRVGRPLLLGPLPAPKRFAGAVAVDAAVVDGIVVAVIAAVVTCVDFA